METPDGNENDFSRKSTARDFTVSSPERVEKGQGMQTVQVAVLGAGLSGLCMAWRLQQAGVKSFVVLEKADRVGGTWRDNTYPGVACDVPSHLTHLLLSRIGAGSLHRVKRFKSTVNRLRKTRRSNPIWSSGLRCIRQFFETGGGTLNCWAGVKFKQTFWSAPWVHCTCPTCLPSKV